MVNEPQIIKELDTTNIDGQVILVATQGLNGLLTINAVVRKVDVVSSVLTALYDANRQAWEDDAAAEAIVSAAAQKAALMEQAIEQVADTARLAA